MDGTNKLLYHSRKKNMDSILAGCYPLISEWCGLNNPYQSLSYESSLKTELLYDEEYFPISQKVYLVVGKVQGSEGKEFILVCSMERDEQLNIVIKPRELLENTKPENLPKEGKNFPKVKVEFKSNQTTSKDDPSGKIKK